MERTEWLKSRKTGLGGSDVAAILGLSKYKSALSVWQDKTSEEIIEIPDNRFMKWGRMLESVIAEAYMEETGRNVQLVDGIIRSKELPFMIGSIDRFITADPSLTMIPEVQRGEGVLECKTAGVYAYRDWEQAVPAYYYAQLMHYLYVTGLQWGAFGILIGGSDFKTFNVVRDEEFIKAMVGICEEFWTKHVQTGVPPEKTILDFKASKIVDSNPVLAPTPILEVVADLSSVKGQIRALESREEELVTKIQEAMGDHDVLLNDNNIPIATWKLAKGRTSLDQKKLKAEKPEVYEKYLVTAEPQRVFRFTASSEE